MKSVVSDASACATAGAPPMSRAARAFGFVRAHRRMIAFIIAVTVSCSALAALEPLILRYLVDGLQVGGTTARLALGIACLGLLCVSREALTAFTSWLTWRTRLRIHYEILDATVGRLHSLSVAYHRSEPVGALMARLDRGIQGVVAAFSDLSFNVLPAIVFLGVSVVSMLRLDGRLSLTLLLFVPLPALVGIWAAPRQTRRDRALLDRWTRIYGRFNEVLGGIVTVKSFAMEHEEQRRFMSHVGEANQIVVRGVGFDARVTALQQLLVGLARVVVLGYGGCLVVRGEISVGTMLAFLGYLTGLFGPVQGLTGIYQTVHRASVSLDAVLSILDAEEHVRDLPNARELKQVRGEVTFERVAFSYAEGSPVLHGIDLQIQPGQTVALVGPSGGGKSTLMALLQRLYDPSEGRVLIDGVDVRGVAQRSLRRQIGVVMQEPLLFNESVRANIAYGRPGASERDIEEAARAANAHEFIQRLPHGYQTEVGERGSLLSAGQRQRIAIARALLKAPPIVILDEATSALDAESEAAVQEALERLLRGRTTLVVAHRLATVARADRIVVLRGGSIVESGTHAELLASQGVYASLVDLQTKTLVLPARAA